MERHFFDGLDGIERAPKPRRQGLTMAVDFGMGPRAQEDVLDVAADFFDFAKIATGISRLLSNEWLAAKIKEYQARQVEPFPGGQYLEYAEMQGKAEQYFPAVKRARYRWVEVSDNLASVSLEWKQRMIRKAAEEHDLRVLGEVGKKEGLNRTLSLADDACACRDAGAEFVLLEAAELVNADKQTESEVEKAVDAVGLERIIFELPGPWIDGVRSCDIHRMRRQLIARYGPQINLGNVMPLDLVSLEAYRRGLGVNAGGKGAA